MRSITPSNGMARNKRNNNRNKRKRDDGAPGAPEAKQKANPNQRDENWQKIKKQNQKFFDYYKV